MSKLLIPNTTQVPNVLLDKVMPLLPAAPLKVLLAIARLTYGFQKRSHKIGFTQLAKLTGLKRRSAIRAANFLGDLIHVKTGGPGRGANEYSLNLDITESQLAALSERCKAGSDAGVTSVG
jgi:phage replication O-like protein O